MAVSRSYQDRIKIMASTSENHVLAPGSLRLSTSTHPYGSSIASSASSSTSSIISLDTPSSQSSMASSTSSLNAVWENENEDERLSNDQSSQDCATISSRSPKITSSVAKHGPPGAQLPCKAVAPEARKHPRRMHRLPPINVNNGVSGPCARPPALVRQCERKDNFVDCLVGKLTCRPRPDPPLLTSDLHPKIPPRK